MAAEITVIGQPAASWIGDQGDALLLFVLVFPKVPLCSKHPAPRPARLCIDMTKRNLMKKRLNGTTGYEINSCLFSRLLVAR
jgi:hypothetical protein